MKKYLSPWHGLKMPFITVLFLIVLPLTTFSQRDFREGYIISNKGDTLYGLIDHMGDLMSSKECVFKQNKKEKFVKYKPFEIQGYRFTDGKFYVSKTISLRTFDEANVSEATETKDVFLEYLLNGIVNLFYYKDAVVVRYFIEDKDGKIYELSNDEKLVDFGGQYYKKESKEYIGILKIAFQDSKEVQSQINTVDFESQSLIKVTKNYHKSVCDDEKCIIYEKTKKTKFRVAPFLGASYMISTKYTDESISDVNSPAFFAGVGASFYWGFVKKDERVSLLFDIGLSNYKLSGTFRFTDAFEKEQLAEYSYQSLLLDLAFMPQFSPGTGKIRPTIAAGVFLQQTLAGKRTQKILKENGDDWESSDSERENTNGVGLGAALGMNFQMTPKNFLFIRLNYSLVTGYFIGYYGADVEPTHQVLGLKVGCYF
jgi:hypothetical protein